MPDPTIPELVARLRELHEKATPGPWSTNHRGGDISARIRGHEVQVALACGQGAMWDERDDAAAIMRANAELIAELRSALPAILDALDHVGDATSSPWRPIEECGELEAGEYLVRMKHGELAEFQYLPLIDTFITIARWSGAEWQVRIVDAEHYYYRAEHITHVHRMGPIRGPGETT